MKSYPKHLYTNTATLSQWEGFADATRFRITSEVLGEIARGDKSIRAVKPKE